MLKDKDAESVFTQLIPAIDQWHCVTLGGYRGQSGDDLNAKLTSVYSSAKVFLKILLLKGFKVRLKMQIKK